MLQRAAGRSSISAAPVRRWSLMTSIVSVGRRCRPSASAPSRPQDFAEHVAALDLLTRAGPLLSNIDRRCRREMEKATGHARPEALWTKLPSWNSTPGYINIPFMLWLYNLARGWGLEEFGRRRYQQLGQDVKWVPGNHARDAGQYDLGPVARRAGLKPAVLGRLLAEAHAMLGVRSADFPPLYRFSCRCRICCRSCSIMSSARDLSASSRSSAAASLLALASGYPWSAARVSQAYAWTGSGRDPEPERRRGQAETGPWAGPAGRPAGTRRRPPSNLPDRAAEFMLEAE